MSGLKGRERLQPSLLDRLTDHNPSSRRDAPDEQALTLAQLRQAVLRDLAALLNTTNLEAVADLDEHPLAAKSTVNYGIPGLAGLLEASTGMEGLEDQLADAIRAFEPRIRSESVVVRSRAADRDTGIPTLLFEIEGELWAQPVPIQLFLETKIEVETRLAVVTESKAAH
jgi:type VI secretion system protein ImpF